MNLKPLLIITFFFVASCLACYKADAQVVFFEAPHDLQLYQRNAQGIGMVQIVAVNRINSVYNKLSCRILRNNILYKYRKTLPTNARIFEIDLPIVAGLYEYKIQVFGHKTSGDSVLLKESNRVLAGDIVGIYGQSNSFGLLGLDTLVFNPMYRKFIRNVSSPAGQQSVENLGWYEGFNPYGHLGVFGLRLGALLVSSEGIPQAFVNGALAGASILQLNDRNSNNPADPATFYGRFLTKLRFADPANKLHYMIWRQGEADAAALTDATNYFQNFSSLRKNLLADIPDLKRIYVAQNDIMAKQYIGSGVYAGLLREQQRQIGNTFSDVTTFSTVKTVEYDGLHYGYRGHDEIARKLLPHIRHSFYKNVDSLEITSPNIQRAYYNAGRDSLYLVFDKGQKIGFESVINYDDHIRRLKDYLIFDSMGVDILSGKAVKNVVSFKLNAPAYAQKLTYLPDFVNDQFSTTYDGPIFKNSRGLQALTFKNLQIGIELKPVQGSSRASKDSTTMITWSPYVAPGEFIAIEKYNTTSESYSTLATLPASQAAYLDTTAMLPGQNNAYRIQVIGEFAFSKWVLVGKENCPDDIDILQPITENQSIKAGQTVSLATAIKAAKITVQAGKSVTLHPGFYTQDGAVFVTKISGCGN